MKLCALFLFLFAFLSAKTQTRQETENWIKQKIVTYFKGSRSSSGDYSKTYYEERNIQVKFNSCELAITTDTYKTHYTFEDIRDNKAKKAVYSSTIKYVIPLSRIKEIAFVSGSIMFKVEQRSIQRYFSQDHGKSFAKKENSENAFVGFDKYGEDNLEERMKKALIHLQTFCPKIDTTEPF